MDAAQVSKQVHTFTVNHQHLLFVLPEPSYTPHTASLPLLIARSIYFPHHPSCRIFSYNFIRVFYSLYTITLVP